MRPETVALLYRNRARWQEQAGDLNGAAASLTAITTLELPAAALAKALAEKGHLYARASKFSEAITAYDASLDQDANAPGRLNILTARAECLLKVKRWPEAAQAFDEVLRSGAPGKANHLAGRALARLRQEPPDRNGALADLTLALALQPGNRAVRTQRGRLALTFGQTQLALADFNEVLAQEQTLPALLGRAQALATLGQHEQAAKDAENALRLPGISAVEKYTAAEVFAIAVGYLDETSRTHAPTTVEEQTRARYQDRAVELLRAALQALPAKERSGFWASYPARDRTLSPVRSSAGFQRLQQEFNQLSNQSKD
jgi:tetratricopeptide (TPR) repeat protein